MFIMHISTMLAYSVLLMSTFLLIWCMRNTGPGSLLGKTVGVIVFFLSLLSLICISITGVKYWKEGKFDDIIPVEISRDMQGFMQKMIAPQDSPDKAEMDKMDAIDKPGMNDMNATPGMDNSVAGMNDMNAMPGMDNSMTGMNDMNAIPGMDNSMTGMNDMNAIPGMDNSVAGMNDMNAMPGMDNSMTGMNDMNAMPGMDNSVAGMNDMNAIPGMDNSMTGMNDMNAIPGMDNSVAGMNDMNMNSNDKGNTQRRPNLR